MRKLFLVALVLCASAFAAPAQTPAANGGRNPKEIPNMGRAPKEINGIGRLDLRVMDEEGQPVEGVRADLESHRTDGFLCESWNWTDARGVAVLPPLHMGRLVLKLKADGYEPQRLEIDPSTLDQPVRVTLHRK